MDIASLTSLISENSYLQAATIFGVSFFVALVVLPLVSGVVRFLTRKTDTDIDDKLSAALHAPIFYFVLLVGVLIALPFLALPSGIEGTLQSITKTLFVLVVAQGLYRTSRVMLNGFAVIDRVGTINPQTLPLFSNLSFIIIGAGAVYGFFLVWGINVTAWLASAGIIGIAVGFAAKDTLSNIISGIFILTDKPYSIGDLIEIGSGTTGIVSDVGLRSTRITTFDDEEVTIPNAVIANEELTNKTTGPDRGRVSVLVSVAYGSDLQKVEKTLLEIAQNNKLVLDDPAPSVRFMDFGDSSLDFMLSCRVSDPLDVYKTKSDMRFAIEIAFRESGIEIPFPQRDVNLKK